MRKLWLALVLAACGCGPTSVDGFSDVQLAVAARAESNVASNEVAWRVRDLYDARLADPTATDMPNECGKGPCTYSREAAAALIRHWWTNTDLAADGLHEQTVEDPDLSTTNIYFDIRGSTLPDEWVLATAHYDAWYGGANDDGTGVAVLVQAAYALESIALDRSVRLLLTDGEERGLVGAGRYVEEFGTDDVVVDVNVDMLAHDGVFGAWLTGDDESVEYIVQASEQSQTAAYAMADLGGRLRRPVTAKPLVFPGNGVSFVGGVTGVDRADQGQFWLENAHAIFPFPSGDKPDWYHTARDTPDVVDPDRLERASRWIVATIAAFATVEQ